MLAKDTNLSRFYSLLVYPLELKAMPGMQQNAFISTRGPNNQLAWYFRKKNIKLLYYFFHYSDP